MTIVKVIEIIAESDTSWEDAAQQALKEASRSVRNIQSIYIKEFEAVVENDNITRYRIIAKVSFIYEGE